tara:strand:- start:8527 stop:9249 length:723 start_codon:yes stop_codon:yes gene_type:complete
MKIIDAFWEERNLGVTCYEVLIEDSDTISSVKDSLLSFDKEYIVIKVPTHLNKINSLLQENGYKFMETTINCVNMAELPELNKVQKRVLDSLIYLEMNNDDFSELFQEIKLNMFEDDRVSIDNHFSREQANKRYIGWIKDEINKGSQTYKICFKNDVVGFFLLRKEDEQTMVAVLGGIYKRFRSFGFGFCMNYLEIQEGIKQNVSRIKTSFSTNNRASTSMHFSLNYRLDEQHNIFVKHN